MWLKTSPTQKKGGLATNHCEIVSFNLHLLHRLPTVNPFIRIPYMSLSSRIDDIPYLPSPTKEMSWRDLNRFSKEDRGEAFYLTCLDYAQYLWRQRLPARAILCLDRAWGADLSGKEMALQNWPLPYRALVYILEEAPRDVFLGNPRAHFQHYADRLAEPRKEQRKWRSWACWLLTRKARPDFPDDPKHIVEKPSINDVSSQLDRHGHPGENNLWLDVMESI